MKRLKLLATLIAVIMCLQSCGIIIINDIAGKGGESESTDTERSSDTREVKEIIIDKQTSDNIKKSADEALEGLNTPKYTGIRVLMTSTDTVFYEGDGSSTSLSSDRVERAEKITGKLDVTVNTAKVSADELYEQLRSAVRKKDYYSDVVAVPLSLVGELAADELIQSLRTVPDLDLDADYFDTNAMSALAAGHSLYAVTGDGCFEPEKLYCIYFNKELANKLGYDMYSLVSEGQWTLEKYAECVSAAVSAGKGAAVTKSAKSYKKMLLSGSGFDFVKSGVDSVPAANTFTAEYESKVKLLSEMPEALSSESPTETFLSGDTLFYIDTVFTAESMADSSLVWGMLPFPKYNKDHEYSTYISDDATVLCLPKYATDNRLSGDFIEALNASSSGYIKYDYLYHNMLDVLRDNGSVNSLDIIMRNPNYDFITAMKSGYPTLYSNTVGAFEELLSGELTFEEYKEKETEVVEYMEKWFPVTYR